jgi:hypothetical protein
MAAPLASPRAERAGHDEAIDASSTAVRATRPDGGDVMSSQEPRDAPPAYHEGMRRLQDRFETRRLADRLDERLGRASFTPEDREFIEGRPFFFLATADAEGRPDCSYKGGAPGFVRVIGPSELEFPSYDGNGMFRSLGNVLVHPAIGMLFIDFERGRRLRVNGTATIVDDDDVIAGIEGAQLVVRVSAERIFPNCPRYIHDGRGAELSPFVPRAGYTPPVPAWKRFDMFRDVLPAGDPARVNEGDTGDRGG